VDSCVRTPQFNFEVHLCDFYWSDHDGINCRAMIYHDSSLWHQIARPFIRFTARKPLYKL
jgi:hypothetical protein